MYIELDVCINILFVICFFFHFAVVCKVLPKVLAMAQ